MTNSNQNSHKGATVQMPEIEIDDLSVHMGGQTIISRLSLRLFSGQKVTLVGRSGCGKSTVLYSLLGFINPEAGAIRIFGRELTGDSVWKLRTRMAYVAQEPQLGAGTVRDFLERPFTFKSNRQLRKNVVRIPELMQRLHLPTSLLDKDISTLSGGEKQRLALISALLLDREILLLDEASSALDRVAKHAVIDLLKSSTALTVLSVSHDQDWIGFSDHSVDLCKAQHGAEA